MNVTLLKREIKANYKLLLIFMAVLTLYGSMIISMFDPKLGESLEQMAQTMPQLFAAFGMMKAGTTLLSFSVNYLYGFLLIAFPSVFIILLSNKLMARYIDRGSMAYLLATSNKRRTIATTQAVVLLLNVCFLIAYMTILCVIVSGAMFPHELEVAKFVMVNVGLLGLLFFLSGLCFFSSSVFNDSKLSNGVGAGCVIVFLLIQMISQVGNKFEGLKYLTPFTLFDTNGLMEYNERAILMMLSLYLAGICLFGIAIFLFDRRDLAL
ncbi:MAG: ABC transporter permease subunit [Velocimicrobium sp.]